MNFRNHSYARPAVPAVLLALALLGPAGCSISDSVQASSDSSSGILTSSSSIFTSSSPESAETQFQDDVREYTATYLQTGGTFDAFQKGIGDLANKHKITNWEATMATYEGVGEGLAEGKATEVQLTAYLDGMAAQDQAKRTAMQKGYDAKKK